MLRRHWTSRRKYNQSWAWLIRQQLSAPPAPTEPFKARVAIHQVRRRLLDPDNLYASVKPILDSLIAWNLIWNDAPAYLDLEVGQEIGKPIRTQITVFRPGDK